MTLIVETVATMLFAIEQMLKKGFDRRKEEEMQKEFSKADKNKDGYLSLDEYMDVFHNHGVAISRDEVGNVMIHHQKYHFFSTPLVLKIT